MTGRLFIHAPNIHVGGGAVLLNAFLSSLSDDMEVFLQVDARMDSSSFASFIKVFPVRPSIIERFKAEKRLRRLTKKGDLVLCFGNLPPIFSNSAKVILFLQNRLLLENYSAMRHFKLKEKLRLFVERLWLRCCFSHVDQLCVQTPTMANLVKSQLREKIDLLICPFFSNEKIFQKSAQRKTEKKYDFLYLAASDWPHKNHRRLIDAWCLLAEEGVFPTLCVTLPPSCSQKLQNWIEQKKQAFDLKVFNEHPGNEEEVHVLYQLTCAVIYPSLLESFGLPLIEAQQMGLPVVASELDYVRDILDPAESFNPISAVSIARAVKRFLLIKEQRQKLMNANSFLNCLLGSKRD